MVFVIESISYISYFLSAAACPLVSCGLNPGNLSAAKSYDCHHNKISYMYSTVANIRKLTSP